MLPVRILLVAVSMLSTMVLPEKKEFVVISGNKITVAAATSLGTINCAYTSSSSQKDTLLLNTQIPRVERLKLAIPVKEFDCGNVLLNRDFAKALNVGQHPYTRIEVVYLKREGKGYKGNLNLLVAGKTIPLQNVSFTSCVAKGVNNLKSNICLNFSEIGLATPKKMGGLFKVEDELRVTVELQLTE
ncbi:hypothetical protein JAO76_14745 [Pontibacter sp. BT310]|uniref:Lipid/polyisoprenoid-binding YceI-like domain-containing protein n=1 Tax=Pontibacter populi TaxID=890055 RepID=A0ABS6XED5_9BACT|nr:MULTISPECIES: hypothetical protein [Pontibacter]MBJ6119465.1 hypothetical protein [Pontibacter sp. BT310]MBR0571893.1 hypothetical protein [Microvirga sp. STS03]MBW3366319.1 hypothetical protein [Pontibacter populi]